MNVTNASSQLTIHLCDLPSDLHSSCLALPIIPPPPTRTERATRNTRKKDRRCPQQLRKRCLPTTCRNGFCVSTGPCYMKPRCWRSRDRTIKRSFRSIKYTTRGGRIREWDLRFRYGNLASSLAADSSFLLRANCLHFCNSSSRS